MTTQNSAKPSPVPPPVAGRLPAHDLDAEAAVLSACMLHPAALDAALGLLRPEHFYSPANIAVFEACSKLSADSSAVDVMTVRNWLRDRGRLDKVAGAAYLAQLVDATPSVHHVEAHARIVLNKWRVRAIVAEAQRIAAEGYADVGSVDEWALSCEAAMESVTTAQQEATNEYIGDVLRDIFTKLSTPNAAGPDGAATGIIALDRLMGPIRPGQLAIIAAGSGIGKSAFAMNVAVNIARKGFGVMVFSAEMTRDELAERALFAEARVDSSKVMRKSRITPDEWTTLTKAASAISPMALVIDDRTDLSPLQIRAAVRKQQAEWRRDGIKTGVVIIDYIQLLNGRAGLGKNATREEEVNGIGRAIKNMAKQCNVPVIALAQLNNDAASRGKEDRRPRATDLRESKALMNHSDKVILIHNPAALARAREDRTGHQDEPLPSEEVELILDKNRGMPTGTVNALFFPSYTCFTDRAAPGWQE